MSQQSELMQHNRNGLLSRESIEKIVKYFKCHNFLGRKRESIIDCLDCRNRSNCYNVKEHRKDFK